MIDVNTYSGFSAKLRLERSHFQCMSHNEFALLSGFFMLGRSEIVQNIPTACTDGVNKKYGEAFVLTLSEPEMNALVLHENGHVMLRHMPMYKHLFLEDAECANKACDYVVNGWIVDTDPQGVFAKLPPNGCYKPEWSNLTIKEIYDILRKEKEGEPEEGEPEGEGEGGFDEHDWEGTEEAEEELGGAEEVGKLVEQAIREGCTLVGKLKGNINRRVTDILTPKIDWKVVFQDWLMSVTNGRGTATWRQFNRHFLAKPFGMLMPHQYEESIKEVILAVDTSGSISDSVLAGVIAEMVKIVESVDPEVIRILWWDAEVQKEQVIKRDQSSNIKHLAEAAGGGGTRMGCVSEYIIKHGFKPDCIVVFTDGYVEGSVSWQVSSPTIFIVDGNTRFSSPTANGKVIFKN